LSATAADAEDHPADLNLNVNTSPTLSEHLSQQNSSRLSNMEFKLDLKGLTGLDAARSTEPKRGGPRSHTSSSYRRQMMQSRTHEPLHNRSAQGPGSGSGSGLSSGLGPDDDDTDGTRLSSSRSST